MEKELVDLLGQLMSGLQVSRSLGDVILGKGTDAYDKLRDRWHMFGWITAEEATKKIIECEGVKS